jgi:hypothetical protein
VDPGVLSWPGELIRLVPHGPPVGEPELSRHVPGGQPPGRLTDPEPLQHPQAVRRQRHARADLGQLLRLLIHPDADPGPRQRNRRCDPADPAADNHRPQGHVLPLSERPAPQIHANPAPVRLAARERTGVEGDRHRWLEWFRAGS